MWTPFDGLVGLHEAVQVEFEKLSCHPWGHFSLHDTWGDDDVAAKGWAGDEVGLALLDFTVEVIFPAPVSS